MSYNWGPHYIVPTTAIKTYSGHVLLREDFNDDLWNKELAELKLTGPITKAVNPWYFRKKGATTWIKIGESSNRKDNFSVSWDTTDLENGQYEVFGMMHISIKKGTKEHAIARENVVEVTVKN